MKKMNRWMGSLPAAVLLAAVSLFAQGTTSRVVGTVTDPSGALVPGATITLTNEATNVSFTTQTTSTGAYVFDSVQVGTYKVAVEKQGFKTFVSTGNALTIGQPMTVNVELQVGEVAQTVQVTGAAQLVQTSTSGNFGNILSQHTIEELPIVQTRGRNPLTFIDFQPGVVAGQCNTGGCVNVNGTRDRAQNFTLDGIDINETSAGGSDFSPLRTNPDTLAEFRVLTNNFTAEYGRNSGAEVTMVSRSGSNALHGDLFEFYQTPRLQANQFINNLRGQVKPQFTQNIYGFSVGGPIRKDKTFFFTNVQFLHTKQSRSVTSTVYTATARQGVFRYVPGGRNRPAGTSGASVDASGNVLPGVTVATYDIAANDPAKLGLDPTAQKVLGLTSLPNDFTVGDGLNTAGFDFNAPDLEKQVDEAVRIDQVFNSANTLFVRWSSGHQNTIGDVTNGGLRPFPAAPDVVDTFRNPRNLAIGWRSVPTPAITNELVLGMNRFTFNFANPDPNFQSNPEWFFNNVAMPLQNFVGNLRALTTLQAVDNFTYIHGAHTFRAGINFRFQRHIDRRGSVAGFDVQPSADLSTSINTVDPVAFKLPGTINTKFDLPTLKSAVNDLLGRVGSITQGFVATPSGSQFAPGGSIYSFDARFPEYDFYGQDTWKLRPGLTVDLGLRWEINLTPYDSRNLISHPNQPFVIGAPPSNTLQWVKGSLYSTRRGDFAPSVGLAWDPFGTGKTSLRANYRLAYDRINTFSLSSGIFPSLPGETIGVDNVDFGESGGRIRDGIPALSPPAGVSPSALAQPASFSNSGITVIDPNWRPAQVSEWALGFERQLPRDTVLSVSYIGNHGVHLYGGYDANQVNIFNNGFLDAFNIVAGGGDSPLINQLMTADPRRKSGETGSQEIRRLFPSTLKLGSVGALAQSLAQFTVKGVPLVVASGFSPFFFQSYPQFSGAFNVLDSNDVSSYNSLQVQIERRVRSGLTVQAGYTLSKSLDTRSFDPTFSRVSRGAFQSASSTPYDIHNRRLNYAPSDFDVRHTFQGDWVWELPFGPGRQWGSHWGPVLGRVLGGWESSGIFRVLSGRPFTVYSGAFTLGNVVQSPAQCPGCPANLSSLQFDPSLGSLSLFTADQRAQFSVPAPGTIGRSRNSFRLPHPWSVDLAVIKHTRITESQTLDFRLEMTNAFNHPNFDTADSSIFSSTVFGRERFASNTARQIQLALKYYF